MTPHVGVRARLFLALLFCATPWLQSAPFTAGNLVVYRTGSGTGDLSNKGNPVFLDEYTPAGVLVQSIALPTAVNGLHKRLVASGAATSEGMISRSVDGRYIVATGYDVAIPNATSITSATSVAVNRVVGRIDGAGAIDTTTALTDANSADNIRGVCSMDGAQFWTAGGTSGIRYSLLGATSSTQLNSTNVNLRQPLIFGGQLYVSSGSGTVRLGAVGSGLPTSTGTALSALAGYPTNANANAFFLADLDAGVAGFDTLYVADDGGTNGGLLKYSSNGTTWTARGTAGAAADAYRGLTAAVSGSTVTLYAVRKGGGGVSGGGEIVSLVDSTGSTGTLTGAPAVLATASANTAFRGVAFTPITDLTVSVSAPATAYTQAHFDFTLTATNAGLANASGVSVQFTLPAGLSYVGASGSGFSVSQTSGVVTFSGGSIAGGASAVLTVTVAATSAATITAGGGAAVIDPVNAIEETNELNNSSAAAIGTEVTDAADLAVSITAPATALTGENFDYSITLLNQGLVNASGVDVQFTLPPGLTYSIATGTGFSVGESGGVVTFSGGSLDAGASSTLTVTVSTLNDGTYTLEAAAAQADPLNTVVESNEGNNASATFAGTIVTTADLAVAMVHNGIFQAGDPAATYTITVANAGTGATKGTVTVSDTLPAGLTATGLTGTGWTIVQGTGGAISATRNDALAAGASYPVLTLTVAIALNSASTLSNTVSVSGGGEINTGNSGATDEVNIVGAGPGKIAFVAPPDGVRYEFAEGAGTVTMDLVRTGGRTGRVRVAVSTVAGTASPDEDFAPLTGSVITFEDGEVSKPVAVQIGSGGGDEPNEQFSVILSDVGGGAELGTRTSVDVLILEPDNKKPTLSLSTPAVNARVPEGAVTVKGESSDDKGVRKVEVSINDGEWMPAQPLMSVLPIKDNFTLDVLPHPGLNKVAVRATDYRGNFTEVSRSFTSVVLRPLAFSLLPDNTFGTATLLPAGDLAALELTKTYTLTATPRSGKVWDGWTAPALSLTAAQKAATSLTFVMAEGLAISASFVADPFVPGVVGDFNGLVRAAGSVIPSRLTEGLINLKVTSSGGFTGNLKMGGASLAFKGLFDNAGHARFGPARDSSVNIPRSDQPDLVLALDMDLNPSGTHEVTGTLGERDRAGVHVMSEIRAARAAFDGKTPGSSAAPAYYTFAMPAQAQTNGLDATMFPQGDCIGSLSLAKTGIATFAAVLADGATATASVPVSAALTAPIYVSLYKNQGSLNGWVTVDHTLPDTDVSGTDFRWFKPNTGGQHHPFGWPEGVSLNLIGARYAAPVGDSVLPDLSTVDGANALLAFSQGGLTSRVEKGVIISPKNLVTKIPANDTSFTLTITAGTGRIAGTFTHTDGTKPTFSGIILQKGENRRAFGYFLTAIPKMVDGSGQSGAISLKTKYNPRPTLVISEFMAKNATTIQDEDGAYSDWIEIYNPGASAVDLTDWCLTDNAGNLTKWRFPAMELGSHEFLLVWASSKNRRVAGQPLHANFSLSNEGEYLGLVRPDGVTIEHQFSPTFPALANDESYGIDFNGIPLVAQGAVAHYTLPANATLGTTWTSSAFKDSSWQSGRTGIGFGVNVPGFTVRQVAPKGSFGGVYNIASCDALLALPKGHANIASETTAIAQQLNFVGDGGAGHYSGDASPPNGLAEPYAIQATGVIQIPTAGNYVFGLNSDDGGRIKIDGVAVMTDDTNHGPEDHLSAPVSLTAGSHSVEVIMWEGGGGDELEFYAAPGTASSWDESFVLVGGIGGLEVSTPPLGSTTGSSAAVVTNVQNKMKGRLSGCYVRVPFTATGVTTFSGLTLKMRYNDGFVAYLNGAEVARRNSPVSPAFDSTATATRTSYDALTPEVIDLTAFLPLLVNGSNVLAIHGMNVAVDDASFLVLPELSAVAGLSGDAVFFSPALGGVTATPGATNGTPQYLGNVDDTHFSVKRGFFSAPFALAITSGTVGAQIRYTLDGSTPTASHGTVYSGPLQIAKTTIIRAAAFKAGFRATNVDTHSYFFLDDVIRQSANGTRPSAAWPAGPINGQVADYGMDPAIVNNTNPEIGGAAKVKEALAAIPTVSLVTDLPNMFDPATGIWVNSGAHGFAWEKPCSVELIGDGNSAAGGFQVNCGMRVRGGYSRSSDNPKHAFHLYFRSSYGASKLSYPLFGSEGASVFDQLDLRTAQNYSWSFGGDGNNTFIREETTRELQGAMGDPYSRCRYYHLYINGQYWGLYNTDERTEAAFGASYLGGNADDYDVIKGEQDQGYTTGVTDGNMDAWQDLWNKGRAHAGDPTNERYFAMQGKAADGVTLTSDPVLLDVDNLIDYMLLTFWTGNLDGCTSAFLGDQNANNWFCMRNRTGNKGFQFLAHDFEHTFFNVDEDRTGPFTTANNASFTFSNPMFLHHDLRPNAEYRMRWADRIHKLMFNNGPLVAESVQARMTARAALVDKVIIAESARWGDSKSATPLTRLNWIDAKNSVIDNYVPNRGSRVIAQLRADGLYPSFDAPTLSQFGGPITNGSEILITGNGGTIYYTLDGSDPRLLGGATNPAAQVYTSSTSTDVLLTEGSTWKYLGDGSNQGTAWRAAGFDDSTWNSGPGKLGYGNDGEQTVVPYVDTDPITAGDQKNATTYFRTTVNIDSVNEISAASLFVNYDDAVAIYINGVEAVRTANLPANPAYNQLATSGTPSETDFYEFVINPALLVEGVNTIAAEVHQVAVDSSDIGFAVRLRASRTSTPSPLVLTGTGAKKLRVRALNGSEWSALVDATFDVRNAADLILSHAHNGNFSAGGAGTYTLTVTNTGTAATNGVVTLSDALPAGLTASAFSGAGWTIVSGTGATVTAKRSDVLAIGASYPPLTLTVAIAPAAPALVTSVATIAGGGDITPANNSVSETTPVNGTGPSQITLSAASYDVFEEAGSVKITVLRTGARTGNASVQLSTANGTAKSGGDYDQQDHVNVDFADGESSREVEIAIHQETPNEPNETFAVTLSNISGAASFGPQTTATVRILEADSAVPTVSVSSPTASARVIDGVAIIKGTAKDNKGIARVQFSLNGAAFADAVTTIAANGLSAAYTASLDNAVNGANTLIVRSIDTRGLISNPLTVRFTFIPLRPLALSITPDVTAGTVAVKPATAAAKLQVGSSYTLKATPSEGFIFDRWTGPGISVEADSLTFTMVEGLALTAHFVSNPFQSSLAGAYHGLARSIDSVTPGNGNHGAVSMTVGNTGIFTGTLRMDSLTLAFSGAFNGAGQGRFGTARQTAAILPRPNKTSLLLSLSLDMDASPSGSHQISGAIAEQQRGGVSAMSSLIADHAYYDGKTLATSASAATVPVLIPALSGDPEHPTGTGSGQITVTKAGMVTFAATLPDGKKVTSAAGLSQKKTTPVFSPMYAQQAGSVGGLIEMEGAIGNPDLLGKEMFWFRPYLSDIAFPFGWPEGLEFQVLRAP